MKPLRVGDVIAGYCGGKFSLDEMFTDKRVEAIGANWVVLRSDSGHRPIFYSGDPDDLAWHRDHPEE